MRGVSLTRVNIDDISELTPRKGCVTINVQINRPPQLEDIDEKISTLIDVLLSIEKTLDIIEDEYFPKISDDEGFDDESNWENRQNVITEEIEVQEQEYQAILQKYNLKRE